MSRRILPPAGFTKTAKPADIKRWRESELTHGRVAMLAALGFVVGEQLEDFPAFMNFDVSMRAGSADHPHLVLAAAPSAASGPCLTLAAPCPTRPSQGAITGPAIYQFQQVEAARPLFWVSRHGADMR